METTPNANTAPAQAGQSNTVGQDSNLYNCTIDCSIRRKVNTMGLPGQDPAERIYRIGASLDRRTGGNLKGISGDLEKKFMPEIVGVNTVDAGFRKAVEIYWSSISKIIPHDEPMLKEHEKGERVKVSFKVLGKARKERFDSITTVEKKIEMLNTLLTTPIKDAPDKALAVLEYEDISNFLLLNYCLKYSKVANSIEDIDKSPKIDFYIFEKSVAVSNQLSIIDLRYQAQLAYQSLSSEPKKVEAVLLMFKQNPANYETEIDKLLRIDELYNLAPIENMKNFISFVKDKDWETKLILNNALTNNNLRTPTNTTAIYYGDVLIGMDINDATLFLDNNDKGKEIKQQLVKLNSK
jgi:hypothetical protein